VKIWIDAQISPEIAQWFILTHGIEAMPVKDLGLRNATDRNIFLAAREAKAVLERKTAILSILLPNSARHRRSCGSPAGTHRTQS